MSPLLLGAAIAAVSAACVLLILMGNIIGAVFAAIGIGLALGMEIDLTSYVTAQLFDRQLYASTYSKYYTMILIASGASPPLFGAIFDKTESYETAVILSSLCILFGAAAFIFVDRLHRTLKDQAMGGSDELYS